MMTSDMLYSKQIIISGEVTNMNLCKVTNNDYVCPNCFRQLEVCQCTCRPLYLIHVDFEIQECVRVLNEKGYITQYSCSSHLEEYQRCGFSEMYLYIVNWIELGNTCPEGFKKDKKNNIFRYHYSKKLTDEEFIKEKNKQLNHLLNWCKRLPEYTKHSIERGIEIEDFILMDV